MVEHLHEHWYDQVAGVWGAAGESAGVAHASGDVVGLGQELDGGAQDEAYAVVDAGGLEGLDQLGDADSRERGQQCCDERGESEAQLPGGHQPVPVGCGEGHVDEQHGQAGGEAEGQGGHDEREVTGGCRAHNQCHNHHGGGHPRIIQP